MSICVRCGIQIKKHIVTETGVGPLCSGCFKLYCDRDAHYYKWPSIVPRETYGFISFNGETKAGPFWKQIQDGQKTTTIREYRADGKPHAIMGAITKLYWRVRQSKKLKEIHHIGNAKVTRYEEIKLMDIWFNEEATKNDGFKTLDEFRSWFYPEWFDLPVKLQDLVKVVSENDSFDNIQISFGRRYGKQTLIELIEALTKPMCLIGFELIE